MKLITLISLVLFVTPGYSQINVSTSPGLRNAVIESWNGTQCGYCPLSDVEIQGLIDSFPGRIVAMNVHAGGFSGNNPDFKTPKGNIHHNTFGVNSYPSSTLNRRVLTGGQLFNYSGFSEVGPLLNEIAEVNMYLASTLDINTGELNVDVEYYYTSNAPSFTNYLYVAVLQNNLAGPQSTFGGGNYNPGAWVNYPTVYNHMRTFRDFVTPQWGDGIAATVVGSTGIMSYTQILPGSINGVPLDLANIEIIAFINDEVEITGNVLNGASIDPTLHGLPTNEEVIFISASVPTPLTCNIGANITVNPEVTVQNWGNNPISTLTINYDINGGPPQVYNFINGINPILAGQTRTIIMDPYNFNAQPTNMMTVSLENPNGVADDITNNDGTTVFNVDIAYAVNNYFVVELLTDGAADEVYIELRDGNNNLIWSQGNENVQGNYNTGSTNPAADPTSPLLDNTNYSWVVTPPFITCYTFIVYDYYGDGLSAGTVGTYSVLDDTGATLFSESNTNFGGEDGNMIKLNSVGVEEIEIDGLNIYPNPATDVINVSFTTDAKYFLVAIKDLQGRTVASKSASNKTSFDVSDLAPGAYLITLSDGISTHSETIIIE